MSEEDRKIIEKFVNSDEFYVIDNYISKPYYETIEEIEQENQQLKGKLKMAEHNKEQSEIQCRRYRNKRKTLNHRIKRREQQRDRYKSVLDEIRKYTKIGITTYQGGGSRTALFEVFDTINEILDKVKE